MYLSATDYFQHKFAPNEQGAREFHAMVVEYLEKLDAKAATLLLTADHSIKQNMTPKMLHGSFMLKIYWINGWASQQHG